MTELARDDGGDRDPDRQRSRGAAPALGAATDSGVPTLALDDTAPGAASTAFQLIHAPEARVASLVRAALKLGARDFGMVGPDSAAGKRLREAFRREVTAGGGRVTADASYPPGRDVVRDRWWPRSRRRRPRRCSSPTAPIAWS